MPGADKTAKASPPECLRAWQCCAPRTEFAVTLALVLARAVLVKCCMLLMILMVRNPRIICKAQYSDLLCRWDRAQQLGLNPPAEVHRILQTLPDGNSMHESIWAGRV